MDIDDDDTADCGEVTSVEAVGSLASEGNGDRNGLRVAGRTWSK